MGSVIGPASLSACVGSQPRVELVQHDPRLDLDGAVGDTLGDAREMPAGVDDHGSTDRLTAL
jgi:hypothetical protein